MAPLLSIVIPAFNEVESLPVLAGEIREVCEREGIGYEAIVIDDGSKDGTFACVQALAAADARIRGVQFRRNCGKAAALSEGFALARGRYVITMDADLQDNPAEIPAIVKMLENGADLVSGWKKKRYDPFHKTMPSKVFNAITGRVAGLKLHDFNCGLKGYKSEVVKSLDLYGELHRYIPVLANWNGFKVEEKAVEHRPRRFGVSKYGWARLTNGMFDLVTLVFLHRYTSRPLHLFGFVGLLFSMIGFLILAGFAIEWAVTGNGHVRPLMLAGMAFMIVGVQFVSIGLLGEMINHRMSDRANPVARTVGL
ncbi:MAG TPA: glycosyltransferase family 2 protein [Fibrobacteria bacterium]|nr:glycosyltransferase family 2 protein [Fibrobacteria bacterium]